MPSPPRPPDPRPGPADLAPAAETLRLHFVEGRITIDDFDRWMQSLHGVRTLTELQELSRSIPPALPPPPPLPPPPASPAGPPGPPLPGPGARGSAPGSRPRRLSVGKVLLLLAGGWLGLLLLAALAGTASPDPAEPATTTSSVPVSSPSGEAAGRARTSLSLPPPAVADEAVAPVPAVGYGTAVDDGPPPFLVDAESDGSAPGQASEAAAARYLSYAVEGDVVGLRQHLCRPLREHFDDQGLVARLDQERAGRAVSYSIAPGDPTAPVSSAGLVVAGTEVAAELRLVAEDGMWKVCGVGTDVGVHGYLLVP